MGTWNPNNPCKSCGNKSGVMVRCANCSTLGCFKCVGSPGKSHCKVCRKFADKVKV